MDRHCDSNSIQTITEVYLKHSTLNENNTELISCRATCTCRLYYITKSNYEYCEQAQANPVISLKKVEDALPCFVM